MYPTVAIRHACTHSMLCVHVPALTCSTYTVNIAAVVTLMTMCVTTKANPRQAFSHCHPHDIRVEKVKNKY